MKDPSSVLLLVGSPRGPRSTSESLGAYMLNRLHGYGLKTEKAYIHPLVKSDEGQASLLRAFDGSDLMVLSFPLYFDSLPSPVIAALEILAEHRATLKKTRKQRLVAISNGSYPQAWRSNRALAMCRIFASETGLEWAGGLALGGGEAIRGKPLESVGRMVRNVKKALDLTAGALAEDKPVPEEAVGLMAKGMIPGWMYVWLAERYLKNQAKIHGAQNKLYDRPYQTST